MSVDESSQPLYNPPYGGTWIPLAAIEPWLKDPTLHPADKKFLRDMRDFSTLHLASGMDPREVASLWHEETGINVEPAENVDDSRYIVPKSKIDLAAID